MKKIFISLAVITLCSCASTSGVVPMGNNSFLISRSEKGFDTTGSAVKADAIKEANSFCLSKNLELSILKTSEKDMVPFKSDAQAEIEFTCVERVNK
ncbi:hypothetical protein [Shewanella baltica]|uniref:hypothetical protein n=1 Tax=Shewanella baltica TaxID=62322 RepID=UPI00217F0A56|nr:hypothetical protein [Shewanella baltica]MCS6241389.1 hypothetical protein [Shewanella baltica]